MDSFKSGQNNFPLLFPSLFFPWLFKVFKMKEVCFLFSLPPPSLSASSSSPYSCLISKYIFWFFNYFYFLCLWYVQFMFFFFLSTIISTGGIMSEGWKVRDGWRNRFLAFDFLKKKKKLNITLCSYQNRVCFKIL